MTDHLRRIREHMALETKALLLEAERARLLDHKGNRGSEAEHGILRWLRARFAPDYTVSSGEIIDSFDTNADIASRQQDGILHRNDAEANRFLLPSGLRLVPIETVAAVVEVKLTLTKEEFDKADKAAAETARLRYHVPFRGSRLPTGNSSHVPLGDGISESGLPMNEASLGPWRPTFALFAFGGVKEVETIAGWLRSATTLSVVCCLEAGCVIRLPPAGNVTTVARVSLPESALTLFAEGMRGALLRYEVLYDAVKPQFSQYAKIESMPYWDDVGYNWPEVYQPTDEETAARERLYGMRPALRSRK